MNDEYTFLTDRRGFMKKTGSLVALGSLPGYLTASTDAPDASTGGLERQEGVVLYRDSDQHSSAFAGILSGAGFRAVSLTNDPVRQWRDGLGRMMDNNTIPVTGLTNWADYLIISGLAAEQRRHVILEIEHSVHQPGKDHWAAGLAVEFLHLPAAAEHETMQSLVKDYLNENPINPDSPSLFSWLIA